MTSRPHDLTKTAPADEERTGTILKAALAAHCVTFRVVPWRSLLGASLVTTAPGQPGVWIDAHSYPDRCWASGYDVPIAGLFGFSAVITDNFNTRHIHRNFTEAPAGITDPHAAADAMAADVAAHLHTYPSLTGAQWVTIASHPASRTEYREAVTVHGTWAHVSSTTGYTTGPSLDTDRVWEAYQRRLADLTAEPR
ncbi:hypothetical protein ACOT81_38645 [Streptomyces sp. WI04-05B]|uniref:Uncharacterized protein n=1 Tax=Streptomyces turgidiscabies (strain Car8) TaxID=698760 RepID=L7F3N9_STRT8|nr:MULTISPECIES: hypothetical protein [Streptomyces]ELP65759.1 hypothetical protein STRTUCAR8_01573 [Streptomyces turgidiscabies Car8]MDX2547519.1 hypothetical protein [Streptomyces sp. WI04-05B]MDX2589912.1 hypothetical protein [Streptomyces sp. WI04-05A]MDX3499785.1 hypothetical protein [Streptomyces turgidiscabies]